MSIAEFRSLEVEPEVFFLGSSHMEVGCSPMSLYDEKQLVTYNMATSAQPIEGSLYFTEEIFKLGYSPKVIVLDVSTMFSVRSEANYRYITDSVPLDNNKLKLIDAYFKQLREESDSNAKDVLSFILPFFKYRYRWQELNFQDLKKRSDDDYFLQGLYIHPGVLPSYQTLDEVNGYATIVNQNFSKEYYSRMGEYNDTLAYQNKKPYYRTAALESKQKSILKIKKLCDRYGCKLLLVKIPVMSTPPEYDASWSIFRHNDVATFAEENGIPFFDMIFDVNSGIDWMHDTIDGGRHLNIRGAEKTTKVLGDYLLSHYDLDTGYNENYEKKLVMYNEYVDVAHLEIEYDLARYVGRLCNSDKDLMVFISVKDDMISNLSDNDKKSLQQLGVRTDFDTMEYNYSFIAMLSPGDSFYEGVSNKRQYYDTTIDDNCVNIISSGYLNGALSSIKINNVEYSMNAHGINFVIYDKESGLVIDKAYCDTWAPEHEVVHNVGFLLHEYHEFLLGRK